MHAKRALHAHIVIVHAASESAHWTKDSDAIHLPRCSLSAPMPLLTNWYQYAPYMDRLFLLVLVQLGRHGLVTRTRMRSGLALGRRRECGQGRLCQYQSAESGTVVVGVRGAVVGGWDRSGCWCGRDRPGREGGAREGRRRSFLAF